MWMGTIFAGNACATQLDKSTKSSFTSAQVKLFERRFEKGYCLTTDTRYNTWLQITHPDTEPQRSATLTSDSVSITEGGTQTIIEGKEHRISKEAGSLGLKKTQSATTGKKKTTKKNQSGQYTSHASSYA